MSINIFDAERSIQFITNKGTVKRSTLDKFVTNYSKLQALKLREKEFVVSCVLVDSEFDGQFLEVKSKLGLEFKLQVPVIEDMQRNVLGQQLFNLTADDEVVEVAYTNEFDEKYQQYTDDFNDAGFADITEERKAAFEDGNTTRLPEAQKAAE